MVWVEYWVPFLDFTKTDLCFQVILFINKSKSINSLWSASSDKGAFVLFSIKSSIYFVTILEFIDSISFVFKFQRIKASVNGKIVATIVSVRVIRSNTEKIADGWMMWDLFTVDLGSIGVASLQSLSYDWIQRFQKHWQIVKSWNGVCDDVFEPFDGIVGFTSLFHEVRTHAARHSWIFECRSGYHDFDGEGYFGEVEISTDDFFAYKFDHLFAYWSHFADLSFIWANFASFMEGMFVPMFLVIGVEPSYIEVYLTVDMIC